eukprot:360874-Chlamydomonas_euryale.AAC.15
MVCYSTNGRKGAQTAGGRGWQRVHHCWIAFNYGLQLGISLAAPTRSPPWLNARRVSRRRAQATPSGFDCVCPTEKLPMKSPFGKS